LTLLAPTAHSLSLPRQTAPSAPPCTRPALLLAADAYIASQTAGTLAPLTPFLAAANWTYEQNNLVLPPTAQSSVLTKPLTISHRRTIVDLVRCATYTELISLTGAGWVIGTQIHHSPDGKVALIDSVASTTGSWLFNATKTLEFVKQEGAGAWGVIPAGERSPREVIQAAGDAYMDLWSDGGAEARVPWGTPCTRLEGGAYTGKGRADDSCRVGVPSNHNQAPNSRRRYVVDEEVGAVSILCVWEHMMNAADSHEFRLEKGKLRYIHTMTECGGKTCKL
ncbi:hypothetical protein B0T18DRAFT_290766, partial [Schizothecium vesticola]